MVNHHFNYIFNVVARCFFGHTGMLYILRYMHTLLLTSYSYHLDFYELTFSKSVVEKLAKESLTQKASSLFLILVFIRNPLNDFKTEMNINSRIVILS